MLKVFLCYPKEFRSWADWLRPRLEAQGHIVLYQDGNRARDESIPEAVNSDLEAANILIPVYGPEFFDSRWCKHELNHFHHLLLSSERQQPRGGRAIIGVKVSPCEVRALAGSIGFIDASESSVPNDRVFEEVNAEIRRAFRDQADNPLNSELDRIQRIEEAFEEFLSAVKKASIRVQLDKPRRAPSLPTREPNFLLFRRERGLVLTICDKELSVDERLLQKPGEAQMLCKLLQRDEVAKLGFDRGFVHPAFRDPHDVIARVFVDASIMFQALYFPSSFLLLPVLQSGTYTQLRVPIGDFFAALSDFFGGKLVSAQITKGPWNDPILLEGIKKTPVLTRFAPTPSNGLHFGNVRTALIPYLVYRSNIRHNTFVLRFDDTDHTRTSQEVVGRIQEELRFLGFGIDYAPQFRQSSPERAHIYNAVMVLLRNCNFTDEITVGDEIHEYLKWDHPDLSMGYWLDLSTGPQMINSPPTAIRRVGRRFLTEQASLTLVRKSKERIVYTYKLAGTVDDLLLTTHVFRDLQQQPTLTPRQALVAFAVRTAWQKASNTAIVRKAKEDIRNSVPEYLEDRSRALPFLAPPIYCHVPIVVDESGRRLRKRNLNTAFSVRSGLGVYEVLPEAIVSYVLSTIIPTQARGGTFEREELGILAGQFGAITLIDIVARELSLEWFRRERKSRKIVHTELQKQERLVIKALSYFQFLRRLSERAESDNFDLPPQEVLERLYSNRHECRNWANLVAIAAAPARWRSSTWTMSQRKMLGVLLTAIHEVRETPNQAFSVAFLLPKRESYADACARIREALIDNRVGVPVSVLGAILETSITTELSEYEGGEHDA